MFEKVNMAHPRQRCEGCHIYERMKKGEPVVNDSCTFCANNPNKITLWSNVNE